MERVQTNNQSEVREQVFYMSRTEFRREQLAHWASLGKSKFRSVHEVRFTDFKTPMLRLQYTPWGNGGGLLSKDVGRERRGLHESIKIRPKCICKSI